MGFEFIKKLPTPEEIRNQYPIAADIQTLKKKTRPGNPGCLYWKIR